VRQVDAGAEHAMARVLGVRDDVAAQHANLGLAVEQRHVHRGLEARDRRLVLGIEVARVAHRDHGGLALPVQRGAFQG
jgi:hypothetical protein